MTILVEEHSDGGHVGHKEEMDEIDVQRTTSDILQRCSDNSQLSKVLLIVAEIHKDDGKQSELSNRRRQIGPCKSQIVPLQHVERRHDDQHDNQRIEPFGVHDTLGLIPIAVDDVTIEEEGEMDEHPAQ